jgi:hypothetical protein
VYICINSILAHIRLVDLYMKHIEHCIGFHWGIVDLNTEAKDILNKII